MIKQFNDLIKQYSEELRVDIEKSLDIGADILKQELINNSPTDSGEFKNSWDVKRQYSGVRYIGNTKTVKHQKSDSVPLSNMLEYSENSKHKGFMQRTFNLSEEKIYQAMVNQIKK